MRKKWVWKTRAARSIALATAAMLVTTNATVPTFAVEVSTVQGENTKTDFSDDEDNKIEASVNEDKAGANSKADETDNAFTDDEAGTTDGSENAGEESTDNSSGGGDETNETDASEDKDKTDEKETDDDSDKDAADEKETDDDSDEDEADDDDEADSDLIDDSETDETEDEKEEDEEETDEDIVDEDLAEEPEFPELSTEDVVTEDASTFAGKDFKAAKTELLDDEASTNGQCGENVSWEYDTETKTLTISGNGAMYDEGDLEADGFDDSGLWYEWYGKNGIETVEIKDGVTTIMPYAFAGCESLTKVTIGNSVKKIGDNAFAGCSISELVIGNSVESIGNFAFAGGIFTFEAPVSIKLPDSLIDIGIGAFTEGYFEKVTFGKKVKTIGYGAFYNCEELTSVIIPDSVTSIGTAAFGICESLKSVVIGTGVKTIGGMAFRECSALETVTLKGNVKTIEQGAFSYCEALESVVIRGEKSAELLTYYTYEDDEDEDGEIEVITEQMQDEAGNPIETDFVFGEAKFVTERDKGITVPNGTLAAYQNAWSDWADYMEEADDPTANITIGADGDEEERDNYLQGNSIEQLMDSVLNLEDIEKLEQGQTVTIWLEIENEADSVPEADKEAIQGKLGDYKEGVYLNIQLKKQFQGEEEANVEETSGSIQISYTVPEELRNTDASVKREYKIIYIHDGQVYELDCSFDEKTGTVTFDADKFSTYSLVYKDTKLGSNSGGSSSGGSDSDDDSSSAGASYGSMPSYVEVGSWNVLADGTWSFTGRNGKSYQNEWAAIYNPYAPKGQMSYDWFRFDENKRMITGWFTDPTDGKIYYLNPISDGTLGRMCTGWQWIDRDGDGVFECYYFNPTSDGTRGSLFSSTTTPDGYQVNENGQWIADGVVQTK